MKKAKIGDYLFYDSKMVIVITISEGERAIIMETLEDQYCPHCGESLGKEKINLIESSLLFQNNTKAIPTICDIK